jgi:ubiquinone/menaquinone biosynthesis C-methylase UbiE
MKRRLFNAGLLFLCVVSVAAGQESYRDRLIRPETVMDTIGVNPGMIIGEAGAGSGYFTFKLADRVGSEGRIYANDIRSSALREIQRRAKNRGVENIQTVLGEVDDPLFPVHDLDMVFMIAAFHDFEQPIPWLENVKRFMKPDASLVIVEKDPDRWGRSWDHHMTREEILTVLAEAGFQKIRVDTFLSQDNIYIYKLPPQNKQQ